MSWWWIGAALLFAFLIVILFIVWWVTSGDSSHHHKDKDGHKRKKEKGKKGKQAADCGPPPCEPCDSNKNGGKDKPEQDKEKNNKKKSGSSDDADSQVANEWMELLYDIVREEKLSPPVASRVYGLTGVVVYESVVIGSRTHRSLRGQLNGLPKIKTNSNGDCNQGCESKGCDSKCESKGCDSHGCESKDGKPRWCWPTVVNSAVSTFLPLLLPTLSQASLVKIQQLKLQWASESKSCCSASSITESEEWGQKVAADILAWSETDGYSLLNNCAYQPTAVPGAWQPTPPGFVANPLQPCWGQLRPMALEFPQQCPPPGHPPFSTDVKSDFYAAALEVYQLSPLTSEQKTIADFWADNPGPASGTPPGHWIAIVSQLGRTHEFKLMKLATLYAGVGIAVHDAFIQCWSTKYLYNLQRPITYIRDNIDAVFNSYLVTPPFPSYASGHSTQSGAVATVLTHLLGQAFSFVDTTHIDHNVQPLITRAFSSFDQAAQEAAVSRLYGQIHYRFDNDDGYTSGVCIGQHINHTVQFVS